MPVRAYFHAMNQTKITLLTALLQSVALAGPTPDKAPVPAADGPTPFSKAGSLSEYFFGKNNAWDSAYDSLQQWKKDNHIPISIGAHHWWHVDRSDYIYGDGYGVPGERGTYYYWLNFDPVLKLKGDGFVNEVGIHFQGRIRDDSDKLRSFYNDNIWTYEAYAFAKTDQGTFKAGQIVEQFCIPWDNSWWEGVAYFDEYRFNPSWGVTWDNTWKVSEIFSVDTSLQYFIEGDKVSGAIANSTAANTSGFEERNSFILRAVPTWKLNEDTKIAWGGAVLTRQIDDNGVAGIDDSQFAWETDLSLTWKNWTFWGQYIDSHGTITPTRYVSGGPSDRQDSLSAGINYKIGPISAHVNYSKGWDHDPDGDQYIFNPGITFQLTKNLTLYTEYVKWNVYNSQDVKAKYDDGFEFALVWTL